MKKTLFIILLVLSVVLAYGSAYALTGVCSGCHTMHNSQNGLNVATGDDGSTTTGTPNASLTISTCIGCHNGGVSSAPNIFGVTYGTNTTAGGTFNQSVASTNSKQHNVQDLVAASMQTDEDVNVTGTPGNGGDSTLTVGLTAQAQKAVMEIIVRAAVQQALKDSTMQRELQTGAPKDTVSSRHRLAQQ